MKAASKELPPSDRLPPLPVSVTTRDGALFDPWADEWIVPSKVYGALHVRFSELDKLSNQWVHRLKLALIRYATTSSDAHFRNVWQRFQDLYRLEIASSAAIVDLVELHHLINYRSRLDVTSEWKLGVLRILFLGMVELGYGGCSDDAVRFLRDSNIKGNVKGTSIRTRDPQEGAFNESELLSIQSALNNAYAFGGIALSTYAMSWLFLAYGVRPIQIAVMKERDVVVSTDTSGARFYALRVPRAKQHGGRTRDSFKTRYCSKQIGQLLELLIEENRAMKKDPEIADGEWPLFIVRDKGRLPELSYHMSSQQVGRRLKNALGRLTGLKTNAKRFRITLAQRAVDDGKDKYTVADLLDHSDTQNVEVYFEASPAMVERLDRHLAIELAPLAQAFAGVLVLSEVDARRGDDLGSRIYDKTLRNNVDRPLGTCGQMSFCGLNAPFACYTCRHFQPWLHAPHEEFLLMLIEDRDRMVDEGYSPKIYSIKNRTILAVAEVIQLCAAERDLAAGGEA